MPHVRGRSYVRGSWRSAPIQCTGQASGDDSIETRIGGRITPHPDGCWLYSGSTSAGYGRDRTAGPIHRFVYETLVGEIPDGYVLHHECRNRACCNPEHLRCLTPTEHSTIHGKERTVENRMRDEHGRFRKAS